MLEQKLDGIRSKALGASLRPLSLAAVFGFGAGSVTEYRAGRYDTLVLYLLLFVMSILAIALRGLDHRIRAAILVLAFYVFGVSELYIFADTGMADVAFIMAIIFAVVFLRPAIALTYMALSFVTVVVFAVLYTLGFLVAPVPPPISPTDAVMWAAYVVVIVFLGAVVFILWRDYVRELLQSMTGERRAVDRLESEVAERIRTELALRESERRWEHLFDSVPDLVMLVDRDLKILLHNREIPVPEGQDSESVTVLEYVSNEKRDDFRRAFDSVTETNEIVSLECEATFDTGRAGWYAIRIAPTRADGQVEGFIVIASDHSLQRQAELERSRAEQAVRSELAFRESIIANAADGICVCQLIPEYPYVRFTLWNQKMVDITGYTLDDLSHPGWLAEFFKDPDAREAAESRLRRLTSGEEMRHEEWQICRKDGDERAVLISTAMINQTGNETQHTALAVVIDITDRKREIEERERLRAQLMHAQKLESVGRLAGGVAHDFNNMLGVIMGTAELGLLDLSASDPSREAFQEIHRAAVRSADLTRQLLGFARKQTVNPQVLDLNAVVHSMHCMLQRLIGEDIQLLWHPADNLHHVKVDPMQLEQILANLVVNARDAIEGHGEIQIETRNRYLDAAQCLALDGAVAGNYVMLSVTDNGTGMSHDVVSQIFEPFFTTKGIGQGTGLGMATVYGIVKQNDGLVSVESTPGNGSTIAVYLPEFTTSLPVETPSMPPVRVRQTSNARVLLVEDEPSVLKMTQQLLETEGYDVTAVSSGQHALAEVKRCETAFDLLITDVVMPDMNGRQLRDQLKASQPTLRTLFMSGYPADVIARRGIVETSVDFIQKPFSIKDFLDKVQATLES